MITKILVLCTGNSCRSQMAEGYLSAFNPGIMVKSAGVVVHGVNPLAIKVMAEDGIDISSHTSNHIDEYMDTQFDVVITVCDHANELCPVFPSGTIRIHHNFSDPSKQTGTEDDVMPGYRKTRDLIKNYVQQLSEDGFIV